MKIEFDITTDFKRKALQKVQKEATFNSLGRAGAYIRTVMRNSIKRRGRGGKPSQAGKPPKSTGPLKDAILFELSPQKDDVAVGPTFGGFGKLGRVHEEGGTFKGLNFEGDITLKRYPKRPFAAPALQKSLPRISSFWKSSIGK